MVILFQAIEGCPNPGARPKGTTANGTGCSAYTRYNQITGATTYDPHGGIAPFVTFNLDISYTLPTPFLPALKKLTFDLNFQNLFDQRYFQYFYRQISPSGCAATGFGAGSPFANANGTPGQVGGRTLVRNNYSCSPQFADGIPGEPFGTFFTITGRF